ncbi:MAG: DNA-protecting protein DprA [Alphaproteobacteria bacterium]|nr:DNA-protecting protein DprA [Alphaproteobacteria bacterium]
MQHNAGLRSQAQTPLHPLPEAERLSWLRLSRTENIGPITFYRLIERTGSATRALEMLPDLSRRGGRAKPLTPPPPGEAEKEYETLRKLGGDIITAACADYPLALGAIDDAPPVISVIGRTDLLNASCIAMVGARNASLNGKKLAERLAQSLGQQGQIIVSGLARGIDTAAHTGALESGTIAVVAGGIDVIYPEENTKLYEAIKERGLIVAESALGQKPFAQSFPRRNRIVSGLSKACVVVEATMRSGSLITARLAGEQGRDVMAVPGSPLDPRADGPNHLIREGAMLIRNAEDVLETIMDFSGKSLREPLISTAPFLLDAEEFTEYTPALQEDVLANLSHTPISIDELLRSCHVTIPVLQTVLLELELAGRVRRLPGNRVSLLN